MRIPKPWRKRKLAEKNQQILVMLKPDTQNVLKRGPYVQIINRMIINLGNSHTSIYGEIEVWLGVKKYSIHTLISANNLSKIFAKPRLQTLNA